MTGDKLVKSCGSLCDTVLSEFEPDAIVDIMNGGCAIGQFIAQSAEKPRYSIDVHRPFVNSWPAYYAELAYAYLPPKAKALADKVNRFLRDNIKPKAKNKVITERKDAAVLLVDDAMDTGHTMNAAMQFLKANGFSNIKTAAITHLREKVKPDYSVCFGNFCFPWSTDYEVMLAKANRFSKQMSGLYIG